MLTSPGADTAVLPTETSRLGQNPDELTVVVFKDNFAARTFRVPLRWISRFGILVGILALLATLSTLLATKYYRLSQHGSPGRVNELEEELNTLRSSYNTLQALQTKTLAQAQEDAKKAAAAANPRSETVPPPIATATPAPKVEPTVAAPNAPVGAARPAGMAALLFQDLPTNVAAAPADVAVKLAPPKFSWHDGTLLVQTALDYTLNDGGNQQGRIVILARGPSEILGYPNSVLNPAATPVLIAPDHGESFSVSRYREINANFGPLRTPSAIQEVEILIFGDTESGAALLIDSRVPVPAPAPTPEAPPKRARPAKTPAKSSAAPTPAQPTPSTGTSASAPNADSPAPWPGTPVGTSTAPAPEGGTAPTTTPPPTSGEGTHP